MDPFSLTVSLMFTDHLGVCVTCNEIHPKIEVAYEVTEEVDLAAGIFYNSLRNGSPYLGVRYTYNPVFVEVGAVGGYDQADVLPFGRIGVNLGEHVSLFAFPIAHAGQPRGAIGLELKF